MGPVAGSYHRNQRVEQIVESVSLWVELLKASATA